jgi:hypothetical protein
MHRQEITSNKKATVSITVAFIMKIIIYAMTKQPDLHQALQDIAASPLSKQDSAF